MSIDEVVKIEEDEPLAGEWTPSVDPEFTDEVEPMPYEEGTPAGKTDLVMNIVTDAGVPGIQVGEGKPVGKTRKGKITPEQKLEETKRKNEEAEARIAERDLLKAEKAAAKGTALVVKPAEIILSDLPRMPKAAAEAELNRLAEGIGSVKKSLHVLHEGRGYESLGFPSMNAMLKHYAFMFDKSMKTIYREATSVVAIGAIQEEAKGLGIETALKIPNAVAMMYNQATKDMPEEKRKEVAKELASEARTLPGRAQPQVTIETADRVLKEYLPEGGSGYTSGSGLSRKEEAVPVVTGKDRVQREKAVKTGAKYDDKQGLLLVYYTHGKNGTPGVLRITDKDLIGWGVMTADEEPPQSLDYMQE